MYAGARDRLFNHVRLGIKEERCIAAFSDQNQSTQRPKDYNIWANREVPGYDFPCQNPYGRYGFFPGVLHTIFRHENPCGLAFIRTMLRMEILRHRVQKDFSRTNLVRETSIFRGKF